LDDPALAEVLDPLEPVFWNQRLRENLSGIFARSLRNKDLFVKYFSVNNLGGFPRLAHASPISGLSGDVPWTGPFFCRTLYEIFTLSLVHLNQGVHPRLRSRRTQEVSERIQSYGFDSLQAADRAYQKNKLLALVPNPVMAKRRNGGSTSSSETRQHQRPSKMGWRFCGLRMRGTWICAIDANRITD
jgi:hypothetical protein